MGLLADRTVRHGAGVEPLDDRGGRLDLLQRHGLAGHQLEQPAERAQVVPLLVDRAGILLVGAGVVLDNGVLEPGHRGGIPEVVFAVEAIVVVAAVVEVQGGGLAGAEGGAMPRQGLGGHGVEVGALDPRGGAGEILTHHVVVQSDGLELLGRMVAAQRRDAHLRDRLEDALLDGGDVLVGQLIGGQLGRQVAVGVHLVDGLEGHVGVDGAGAVAAEEAEVHHLAGLAALDHDADVAAHTAGQEAVVQGGGGQQAGDGRHLGRQAAVAEDHQRRAVADRPLRPFDQLGQRVAQVPAGVVPAGRKEDRQRGHLEIAAGDACAAGAMSSSVRIGCGSLSWRQ